MIQAYKRTNDSSGYLRFERRAFTELNDEIVAAYDIGTGSVGICLRKQKDVRFMESFTFPALHGSKAKERETRRIIRTREAHRLRERRWDQIWESWGGACLSQRDGQNPASHADARMNRQFPSRNEGEVYYHGALISIAAIQGADLEEWQIYKAIRHTIQLRGYDPNVAWANSSNSSQDGSGVAEDQELRETLSEWESHMAERFPPEHHLPCYFQAERMGLYDSASDAIVSARQTGTTRPYRGRTNQRQVYPRHAVDNQLRILLDYAAKRKDQQVDIEAILYGPSRVPYVERWRRSYGQELSPLEREEQLRGIFGQRYARFQNRAISPCCCIPQLHASKRNLATHSNVRVVLEAQLLLKLINLRFTEGERTHLRMDAPLIGAYLRSRSTHDDPFKLNATELKRFLKTQGRKWVLTKGHDKEELAFRTDGRAAFSKIAAHLIRELILSGKSPEDFHRETVAAYRKAGVFALAEDCYDELGHWKGGSKSPKHIPDGFFLLCESHLTFLREMGDSWERIHLPDSRVRGLADAVKNDLIKEEEAIAKLIGAQSNPRIRLRLELILKLHGKVCEVSRQTWGKEPDRIVVELPRDKEFSKDKDASKRERKRANEYIKRIEQNEARWVKWEQKRVELGLDPSWRNTLKAKLYTQQKRICVYSGKAISRAQIKDMQIEHIVPRAQKGTDVLANFVLADPQTNSDKGNKTPWEKWGDDSAQWTAIEARVERSDLDSETKRLLLAPDAPALLRRFQKGELGSTAWITKIVVLALKLKIESIHSLENVVIEYGRNVSDRRNKLHYASLNQRGVDPPAPSLWMADTGKKDRGNHAHHAVDALLASFWNYRQSTMLETGIDWFEHQAQRVLPRQIIKEPPAFLETIYGRLNDEERSFFCRWPVEKFGIKGNAFSPSTLKKHLDGLPESRLKTQLTSMSFGTQDAWLNFCRTQNIKRLKRVEGTSENDKAERPEGSGRWFAGKEKKACWVCRDGDRVRCIDWYPGQPRPEVPAGAIRIENGDWMRLEEDYIPSKGRIIPGGVYKIGTIMNGRSVVLYSKSNESFIPNLNVLLLMNHI